MSDWKIFHNPNCSKSREALALLETVRPEVVEYLKTPPTEADLLALLDILQGDFKELVRTKEEGFLKTPFSLADKETIARELAKRPELLERPIVVQGKIAIVARPIERLKNIL